MQLPAPPSCCINLGAPVAAARQPAHAPLNSSRPSPEKRTCVTPPTCPCSSASGAGPPRSSYIPTHREKEPAACKLVAAGRCISHASGMGRARAHARRTQRPQVMQQCMR